MLEELQYHAENWMIFLRFFLVNYQFLQVAGLSAIGAMMDGCRYGQIYSVQCKIQTLHWITFSELVIGLINVELVSSGTIGQRKERLENVSQIIPILLQKMVVLDH